MKAPELEYCDICGEPTGRAGRYDDSLFLVHTIDRKEVGPLCEDCYDNILDSGHFNNEQLPAGRPVNPAERITP